MQRLQYIPTAIAISLLIANAYSTDTNAITNIVGGHNIQIDVVPHQVAIVLREKLLCGGSILTKKYVLSAAHCVLETLDISLIIHAGTSFWAKPGSIHHVESSTTYGASENVDVAVLRVTEPFVFDKKRQPIR
ncbi:PREDICTED: trypsin-5-like [Ceratosolen solmsi marchali]|uniref:trypsin n=1 Tax=Ceratosolen solmsi marchali TaxID=326594 RepID=A0AAJ6YQ41_9HYME|nr:PREDICTED: trypsin-5-like [Ceratosolen solmsi marchali]